MTAAADKPTRTEGERAILQFELINLALVAVTVVIVHLTMGTGPFLWGALAGGVLGAVNLRVMVFIGRRILRSRQKSRAVWVTLFALKLVVLCTAVWLSLTQLPLDALGFLVGFATMLPASLVLTAVRALESPRTATSSHGERRL